MPHLHPVPDLRPPLLFNHHRKIARMSPEAEAIRPQVSQWPQSPQLPESSQSSQLSPSRDHHQKTSTPRRNVKVDVTADEDTMADVGSALIATHLVAFILGIVATYYLSASLVLVLILIVGVYITIRKTTMNTGDSEVLNKIPSPLKVREKDQDSENQTRNQSIDAQYAFRPYADPRTRS